NGLFVVKKLGVTNGSAIGTVQNGILWQVLQYFAKSSHVRKLGIVYKLSMFRHALLVFLQKCIAIIAGFRLGIIHQILKKQSRMHLHMIRQSTISILKFSGLIYIPMMLGLEGSEIFLHHFTYHFAPNADEQIRAQSVFFFFANGVDETIY